METNSAFPTNLFLPVTLVVSQLIPVIPVNIEKIWLYKDALIDIFIWGNIYEEKDIEIGRKINATVRSGFKWKW